MLAALTECLVFPFGGLKVSEIALRLLFAPPKCCPASNGIAQAVEAHTEGDDGAPPVSDCCGLFVGKNSGLGLRLVPLGISKS